MTTAHNNTKGFSMVETLVVIFIVTVIGLGISLFGRNIFSFNTTAAANLNAQQDARGALKSMSAEVRSLSPASTGAFAIADASPTSFTFYTDLDNDGLKERVRYFLTGNTLQKGVIKPSGNPITYNSATETLTNVAGYITNGATPIFSYYNDSYDGNTAPLSTPVNTGSVSLVKVTLIINRDPTHASPITMTTQVTMRNLKDNL